MTYIQKLVELDRIEKAERAELDRRFIAYEMSEKEWIEAIKSLRTRLQQELRAA